MGRSVGLVTRASAVLIAALLLSGVAQAQTQIGAPPPPVFSAVDENGVDLSNGRFARATTETSVGSPGEGGLQRTYLGTWLRDNLLGTLNVDGTKYTVSIGETSVKFTQATAGGPFTADPGSVGTTLSFSSAQNTYTYTTTDGTVATFSGGLAGVYPIKATAGLITSLQKPNGETLTYTYDSFDPSCTAACSRPRAVTSSLGYMIKYEYAGTSYNTGSLNLSRAVGVNLSIEYCSPTAASCSFTRTWNWMTYTYPSGAPMTSTTTATDSLSRATTYTSAIQASSYTPESYLIIRIQRPSGVAVDISYNPSTSRVTSVASAAGTWTYSYTTLGNGDLQTTRTDPLGHTRVVVSDSTLGYVKSVADGLNRTTTYTVNPATALVTQVTYPEGNYDSYAYDARGNVTSVTKVAKPGSGLANYLVTASFPASCANPKTCNKPDYVIDGGARTDFTYDPTHGGVLTATGPAGANGVRPQNRYSYTALYAWYLNSAGSLVQAPTSVYKLTGTSACMTLASCTGGADEAKSTIVYGSAGTANNLQATSVTNAAGNGSVTATTAYTYNIFGDVRTVDGPLAGTTDTARNRLDTARQLVGRIEVDPDGEGTGIPARATRYTYNPDGQIGSVDRGTVNSQSDADWTNFATAEQQVETYDAAGRLIKEALVAGGSTQALTQYTYDAANRLDCTAARMNPAVFASPPASACTLGTAGGAGPDRIAKTNYNNADQVTSVIVAYGTAVQATEVTKTYRPNGPVDTLADGRGGLTTYEYDGFDRLTKVRYPSASNGAVSSTTDYEQYTYDATTWTVAQKRLRDGGLISYSYDGRRRVTHLSGAGLADTDYVYDNFGRSTALTYTTGGQSVTTAYNALGQVTSAGSPQGSVIYLYDAGGRRSRMTWPDGFYVAYTYDNAGALKQIRENGATSGAGLLAVFTYDNLGRRSSLSRGNGVATTYAYDAVSRLQTLSQNLTGTAKDQTLTFGYNPADQITSRTSNNTSYAFAGLYNTDKTATVNGLNQVSAWGPQALGYDGRGNLTSEGAVTYSYDGFNRLKTISGGASLAYDPAGRLYQSTTSGGTVTRFAYDGADMIGEYNSSNALQRRYVHGPDEDEPLVWYEGSGTTDRRWLVADQQGSIVAVTDGAGAATVTNTYDEYGVGGGANDGRFRYTGQMYLPEFGLYHYKARAYSPSLGRFLQTDPIGYGAGMNMHAYVGGDPVNRRDPSGLAGCPAGLGNCIAEAVAIGTRQLNQQLLAQVVLSNQQALRTIQSFGGGAPTKPAEEAKAKSKKKTKKRDSCFVFTGEGSIGLQLVGNLDLGVGAVGVTFDLGSLRAGYSNEGGFYTKGTQKFSGEFSPLPGTVFEAGFRREGTLSRGANPGSFTKKPLQFFAEAKNKAGVEVAEIFGGKLEGEVTTDCLAK